MILLTDLVILSLSQSSKLFNQLHQYDTINNKWSQILCPLMPPGKAGHGATVVGDLMVVFGGYHGQTSSSNQVWVYHIEESSWEKKEVDGMQPVPRYGHTQVRQRCGYISLTFHSTVLLPNWSYCLA
jgi:F-box protein 42